MLLHKLREIENGIRDEGASNTKELIAALTLKDLLLQIDYNSEHISDFSLNRMTDLLNDLKGDDLSDVEASLVKQLLD
ncbi:hypothetical protein F6U93_14320 [Tamlana haliotis]|uniref:Uncharacterized protein n=1 Tax=Pseudotamlana haliotis TaxID=2614804 RepID=A0A6N6MFB6_9FLAO|nr:hypothetical protein [Tamlana haliotis]KAB1066589.1 hypothetical protein F6U93_14320 [Tamlana haliotis]